MEDGMSVGRLLRMLLLLLPSLTFDVHGMRYTSTVNVIIPQSLHSSSGDGYSHQEARFGPGSNGIATMLPPRGTMVLSMQYVNSSLCTDEELADAYYQLNPAAVPFGLIVDRPDEDSDSSSCTFVQQVRQGQHLGAAIVILANHLCECNDHACALATKSDRCESEPPILQDDGSGSDIHIPSLLLSRGDSQPILNHLLGNSSSDDGGAPVVMEFQWHPYRFEYVFLTLWHSPYLNVDSDDPSSQVMMDPQWWNNLSQVVLAFGPSVEFIPRYLVSDGYQWGCGDDKSNCQDICTNGGRYCVSSPDPYHYAMEEIILRMCLWERSKEIWWKYVTYNAAHCGSPSSSEAPPHTCREEALKAAGMTSDAIDSCVQDSGGWDKDNPNSFLDQALTAQHRYGGIIANNPTIHVNDGPPLTEEQKQRGNGLSSSSITNTFRAICDNFLDEFRPEVCRICRSCFDPMACIARSEPWSCHSKPSSSSTSSSSSKRKHFRNFILWLLLIGCGIYGYNKYQRLRNEQDLHDFFENHRDYTVSATMFGNNGGDS
eukprot:scaffold2212_cov143-Cylindrotheca_fusiformis.AAC.9